MIVLFIGLHIECSNVMIKIIVLFFSSLYTCFIHSLACTHILFDSFISLDTYSVWFIQLPPPTGNAWVHSTGEFLEALQQGFPGEAGTGQREADADGRELSAANAAQAVPGWHLRQRWNPLPSQPPLHRQQQDQCQVSTKLVWMGWCGVAASQRVSVALLCWGCPPAGVQKRDAGCVCRW